MAETISNVFADAFHSTVTHLAQQTQPRFAAHALHQSVSNAERDTFDQMPQTTDLEITGERYTSVAVQDAEFLRRSVWKRDWAWYRHFRTQDQLAMLMDPQRNYIRSATYAMVRRRDQLVLDALLGNAYTGRYGNTILAFPTAEYPTGNTVDATATGMIVDTFITVRRIFNEDEEMVEDMEGDTDLNAFCAALSPQAHAQLLSITQVQSSDFYLDPISGRMPLVSGQIPYFMGFRIRVTNRLPKTGTTRHCVFWHRHSVGYSTWANTEVNVSRREDLNGAPYQVRLLYSTNSTRLRETGVYRVDITEV